MILALDAAVLAGIGAVLAGVAGIITAWAGVIAAKRRAREQCDEELSKSHRELETQERELHEFRMREADGEL